MEPAVNQPEAKAAFFPVYQMMDKWAAFAYGTPEVKSHHHALYYAFVTVCKNKGGMHRFTMPYQTGMELSGIGSKSTYLTALKEMEEWGFLKYTPGANRFTVPIIEVHFCPSIGNLLALYRESIGTSIDTSTSTSTDTSTGRIKELLDLRTKELEDLRTSLLTNQTELAAANAALSEAQKKIGEWQARALLAEAELDTLKAFNASASHTRGARRPKQTEEPADFVAFYEAYPKREKRKDALAAWLRLNPKERSDAYELACEWFAARPDLAQPERYQYIPAPAVWLNQKRWTDAPPPVKPQSYVNGNHQNQHGTYRGNQPNGRLNVEEAVGIARNIALGVDAAQRAEAATGCHDGSNPSYGTTRPAALRYSQS